jgi:predicted amidohydrolase YtcJ
MQVLWIATNRKTRSGQSLGPEQCISPLSAIKAMTLDAAFTLHEDHRLGSIEVGKLADFAVLDKNPLTIPVSDINQIKVVTTILGGIDTNE